MKPGIRNTVLILLIVVFSIAAGSFFSIRNKMAEKEGARQAEMQKFAGIQGNILSPVRKISVPFLVKQDGSPFTIESLQGHWSIMFFGFTNCGHICPTAMSVLAQAKKMAEDKNLEFPDVFMVSVDPERDTPAAMEKFMSSFDSDFTGVTGDAKLLKALSLQMSVIYMRAASNNKEGQTENDDNYQVDHSSSFLLMDKQGNLVAFLNPPHSPEKVLKDIRTIIDASK
jgi:protein SCO1/2